MAEVTRIERPGRPAPKARKKVAAYARVSKASEQLEHSLAAQISYYNELIQRNPEWEFAGVYTDDGITGTSTSKRKGFQQMVADADAGKIDIILTKSISRFARNTVNLLQTVRHLKSIGVSVRFDREHIDSMTADGEVMLTILASFAEAESRNMSQNITWAIRKKFQNGEQNGHPRMLGYEWDGEKYRIVPEEAEQVRRIFREYASGKSAYEISGMGFIGIEGAEMQPMTVISILDNEFYSGDLLLQKTHRGNKGHSVKNRGELPKILVKDDHEPIIDEELYEKVAARRQMEKQYRINNRNEPTIFSGKVFCGRCGSICNREEGKGYKIWRCRRQVLQRKKACQACPTWEREFTEGMKALGITEFDRILIFDERVEFYVPGSKKPLVWQKEHVPFKYTRKLYCGTCGGTCVRLANYNKARHGQHYWTCKRAGCLQHAYEDELDLASDALFPEEGFRYGVKKAIIYKDRFEFITNEGETRTWQRT